MIPTIYYRLIDLVTGEVLFERQSSWGIVQPSLTKKGKARPGIKVWKGEYLALYADQGSGWMLVRDFTGGWVQLITHEERQKRAANYAAACSFGHFTMVSTTALDAMSDSDAFRFLALLTRYHRKSGTITGITTAKKAAGFLRISPSNVAPTLTRLIDAGLIAWEGDTLRVLGGVQHEREDDTLYVFGYGIRHLLKKTESTKHSYIGRLFRRVSAGEGGVVYLRALDTKARTYCEEMTVGDIPIITRLPKGCTVSPLLAFLGAPQQRPDALDSWVTDHHLIPA